MLRSLVGSEMCIRDRIWGAGSCRPRQMGNLGRLAVAGMLMSCLECWAFEVLALIAGRLAHKTTSLAAHGIVFNMSALCCQSQMGISVTCNIRVGLSLGAGDVQRAKAASKAGLVAGLALSIMNGTVLLLLRNLIPTLFVREPEVRMMASETLVLLALYQAGDGVNGVCNGIIRAAGHQCFSVLVLFVSYYCIGLPLSCWLAFHQPLLGFSQLSRLWVGIMVALCMACVLQMTAISCWDWNQLVYCCPDRDEKSEQEPTISSVGYGTFVRLDQHSPDEKTHDLGGSTARDPMI
eukprot:TRINITY_DN28199_c0_g1_i2.p1 TRINITY_DN28199_c0_g1~~TRINITY_DN28199_c0_g1_i2.p1  ORF type:complete len:293 (-),score=65.35 TRINITY_DN28199_c0_g1_i2:422-1300(-)